MSFSVNIRGFDIPSLVSPFGIVGVRSQHFHTLGQKKTDQHRHVLRELSTMNRQVERTSMRRMRIMVPVE